MSTKDVEGLIFEAPNPKGRPKNKKSEALNVIGIPKKKEKLPFPEKNMFDQKRILIKDFLPANFTENILKGDYILELADLKKIAGNDPNKVPDTFMDCAVNLDVLKDVFRPAAFKHLQKLVTGKKKAGIFKCPLCNSRLDQGEEEVFCESCLQWFHVHCDPFRDQREPVNWYCSSCVNRCMN